MWCPAIALAVHAKDCNQINLLANSADYHAQSVDPTLLNAWGIAIRPAGFGDHFWLTSNGDGASKEYLSDVGGTPLFQDELEIVVWRKFPLSPLSLHQCAERQKLVRV